MVETWLNTANSKLKNGWTWHVLKEHEDRTSSRPHAHGVYNDALADLHAYSYMLHIAHSLIHMA